MDETTIELKEEKAYTLRKLCADDIFPFCTILSKVGIKEIKNCFQSDELKALAKNENGEGSVEEIGMKVMIEVAGVVISNIENCKGSLYQLLSSLSGMDKDMIGKLDMATFIEMIIDVFKKEEFKDFFKAVSKLLK